MTRGPARHAETRPIERSGGVTLRTPDLLTHERVSGQGSRGVCRASGVGFKFPKSCRRVSRPADYGSVITRHGRMETSICCRRENPPYARALAEPVIA